MKDGSPLSWAFDSDAPAVLGHNSIHDVEPEARALSGLLGGEERIENLFEIRLGNPGPIVLDPNMHLVPGAFRTQSNSCTEISRSPPVPV